MGRPLSGNKTLISDLAALNSKGTLNSSDCAGADSISFYIIFGPLTSAGSVTIEGAHDPDYAGTWAAIATIDWAVADSVHNVNIPGNHICVRARISDAIVGGTVKVIASVAG